MARRSVINMVKTIPIWFEGLIVIKLDVVPVPVLHFEGILNFECGFVTCILIKATKLAKF